MAEQESGGNGATADETFATASDDASSLNGFASAAPQGAATDRPEVLIAGAVLGGLLLAGLVSRIGR